MSENTLPVPQTATEGNLTTVETARRIELEAVIDLHREGFLLVATALAEIRANRLYRETHSSFAAYCQERHGFGANYAHKLIEAAEVSATVEAAGVQPPRTEAQARELKALPAVERAPALEEARRVAGDKEPTQRQVREAVHARKPPVSRPVPLSPSPSVFSLTHAALALLDDLCRRRHMERGAMAEYAFRKYSDALDKAYGKGNAVPLTPGSAPNVEQNPEPARTEGESKHAYTMGPRDVAKRGTKMGFDGKARVSSEEAEW